MENEPQTTHESSSAEEAPREYRIVLRRGWSKEQGGPLEPDEIETSTDVAQNDVMWEGETEDLRRANLWEKAGLTPTDAEDDLYELQEKDESGYWELAGYFRTEEDYEVMVETRTQAQEVTDDLLE